MTLQEAAAVLHIDLESAVVRFGGNEGLYRRFLGKLAQDKTFAQLEEAVNTGDWESVERAAHTLKGVAANLGLEDVRAASDAVVQAVRAGDTAAVAGLFRDVALAFRTALDTLGQLT